MARGITMFQAKNYVGCINQMTLARQQAGADEVSDYYIALSTLAQGGPDALKLLEGFIEHYPESLLRPAIQAGIGDYYYSRQEYEQALVEYAKVSEDALTGIAADDYLSHKAFCYLKRAEYDQAAKVFRRLESSPRMGNTARFYQGYIAYCRKDYDEALTLFQRVNRAKAPGNKTDYYVAQIYYVQQKYPQALSTARRLLEDKSADEYRSEMLRIAGESCYQQGDESNAIPYLKKYAAEEANPQPTALYILGVSQYNAGDYADAIATLGKVTEADDAIAQSAYLYIGQAAMKQGNTSSALMAFDNAYKMSYNRQLQETALYNYAVAKAGGGRMPFGSSVAVFEDFLSKYPSSRYADEVQQYIIAGYMTDNNYEAALASIEKISHPSAAVMKAKQRVLFTLGTRDVAEGKIDSALQRLDEARRIGSDAGIARECQLWMGDCYYRKGRYDKATETFRSYLTSARRGENTALARYDLGYSLFAQRQYSDALSSFSAAIKSPGNLDDETVSDAYNRVGDCYYYANDYSHAATNYDKAYELNPASGDYAMFQHAMMRGLQRDYKGKLAGMDRMIDRYPSSALVPSALLEKAESHSAMGDNAAAIGIYRQLVEQYPSTSQGRSGYLQLAITQLSLGHKTDAITAYRNVIKKYPTSEEARVASDDLKRIYAEEGNLEEYARFIAAVPNAPKLEASEADNLTFSAAEKAYLADTKKVSKLKQYIERYPNGANEAQALYYLASSASEHGDDDAAIEYASRLLKEYPDAEATEDVLAIKGKIEMNQGKGEQALATFRALEKKASAASNVHAARMGILRVSRDMGRNKEVVAAADRLLASSAAGSSDIAEIKYSRATALNVLGKHDEAEKVLGELAKNPDNVYGARAAVDLGQHYYDKKQYKKAEKTVNALIDANPPHQYWLARGFILLSDIYKAQGKDYEAREYLKSLRSNYPGKEADIQDMIDQRLK